MHDARMLSIAERSAMRLDGELFDVGATALHIDRIVGPVERVRALGIAFHPAHIVAGRSAAWVHGVAPQPRIVEITTLRHRRADVPLECRASIRRVSLTHCVTIDGVLVTGRLRTAVDLLADAPFDAGARAAVRMLVDVDDAGEVRHMIATSGRRGVTMMRARLDETLSEAVREAAIRW